MPTPLLPYHFSAKHPCELQLLPRLIRPQACLRARMVLRLLQWTSRPTGPSAASWGGSNLTVGKWRGATSHWA